MPTPTATPPPEMMRALLRRPRGVELTRVPTPRSLSPDQVLIQVSVAGLCRTDCAVATGEMGAPQLILGHEIAGVVVDCGTGSRASLGATVSVDPRVPGGFLGVDVDGGFAEYLRVPMSALVHADASLDPRAVAYIEPLAATLAVLDTDITTGQRGAIVGSGRIAALTAQVLAIRGFERVSIYDPETGPSPPASSFDFAIETGVDAQTMTEVLRMVRPRGQIVIKSRTLEPLVLDTLTFVAKELTLSAAYYGCFAEAATLLGDPGLDLASLWTTPRPLEDFAELFERAAAGEAQKLFFAPAD